MLIFVAPPALQKRNGVVPPVPPRVQVVRGVVAVVEAEAIRADVEERDAGAEVRGRVEVVDEGVLAPVADHEGDAHAEEREEEDEDGGSRAEVCHECDEGQPGDFRQDGFERRAVLPPPDEVAGEVEPGGEHEVQDVMREVPGVVALVADRAAEVAGPVALDVVVLDVVEVVGVPGVAHERVEEVGEDGVEPR